MAVCLCPWRRLFYPTTPFSLYGVPLHMQLTKLPTHQYPNISPHLETSKHKSTSLCPFSESIKSSGNRHGHLNTRVGPVPHPGSRGILTRDLKPGSPGQSNYLQGKAKKLIWPQKLFLVHALVTNYVSTSGTGFSWDVLFNHHIML